MQAVNLIPPQLTGQEFLASSHLKIGYDDRYAQEGWNSTFDSDFKPPGGKIRPEAALPPLPARFMHGDDEKVDRVISETREAYPVKSRIPNSQDRDKYSALYKTNFKPNSDQRIDGFNTTHDFFYKPKPVSQPPDNSKLALAWTGSSFPQGDKEKAEQPISLYRSGFKGHDTNIIKIEKVQPQHYGGPPTIRGDKASRFGTTHNETYNGIWNVPPSAVPKHHWSSIPEGDKEKVMEHSTTMRKSYTPLSSEYVPQSSEKTYTKLFKTNYTQRDSRSAPNQYNSTAKDSYGPLAYSDQRFRRSRDRNASDIPEGDYDPSRGVNRINLTTTRSHHPPMTSDTVHVDGSKLRTRSNVLLGEPTLQRCFYDTTSNDTYKSLRAPRLKAQTYYPSVVPLDYYGKQTLEPTTWSEFKNPRQKRIFPDPLAVENLQKTHISAPLGGQYFLSTTHNACYTPKRIQKVDVDPGSLQRSSIPIGTLGQHIPGCHNGWDVAA